MIRAIPLCLVLWLAMVACDEDPARATKIVPRPPAARAPKAAQPAPAAAPALEGKAPAAGAPATERNAATTVPAAGASGGKRSSAGAGQGSGSSAANPAPAAARSEGTTRIEGCPPPPEEGSGPSALVVTGPCAFEHKGMFSCEASADDFYISASRKGARGATVMVYINVEHYKGPGAYKDAQMFVGVQDKTSIQRWSSDTVDITVGPGEEFAVLPSTRLDAEPVLVGCSGPMTNFQCGGRDALETPPAVVSGTMRCEGGGEKKKK